MPSPGSLLTPRVCFSSDHPPHPLEDSISFFFCLHPLDSGQQLCSFGFVLLVLGGDLITAAAGFYAAPLILDLFFTGGTHIKQQLGGSVDAPFWLKLEMEMLTLLFHSLWILQCNTVNADSIIHIGKRPSGAVRGVRLHGLLVLLRTD